MVLVHSKITSSETRVDMLWRTVRYLKSLFIFKKYVIALFVCCMIGVFILHNANSTVECQTNKIQHKIRGLQDISPELYDQLKKKWLAEEGSINSKKVVGDEPPNGDANPPSVAPLECLINDEYPIRCLKTTDKDETVYMPFSFVEKYFEVYGTMKHYDGYDRFEFLQSFAKVINEMKIPYSYNGTLMTFHSYSVEIRDRMKFISGIEGVPLSSQWGKHGYFYAIQICQFGLSHYCKHLVENPPQQIVYEDAESGTQSIWKTSNRYCVVETLQDASVPTRVIKFSTPESIPLGSGVSLQIGNAVERVISFDIKFVSNGSISIVVESNNKAKQYTLHYVTSSILLDFDHLSNIFYGIGPTRHWRHITRDLLTDLRKGIGLSSTKKKRIKTSIQKVSRIILRGEGFIDNVTLSTTEHMSQFRDASEWIAKNQDPETGGWKNDIERVFAGFNTIPPGWISAMGQGQSLSLLARAYYIYQSPLYLKSLTRGLQPYTVLSSEGGVRAMFMNKYVWYEEYPTTPSSFVLNGFIYSLIGLYDFKSLLEDQFDMGNSAVNADMMEESLHKIGVDIPKTYKLVSSLFEDGLASLKAMLPLYDGGSRTFYDLRHFMLKTQPNIARWDYHATHLSQLALLASISDDPIFKQFFQYWTGYTKGRLANHN